MIHGRLWMHNLTSGRKKIDADLCDSATLFTTVQKPASTPLLQMTDGNLWHVLPYMFMLQFVLCLLAVQLLHCHQPVQLIFLSLLGIRIIWIWKLCLHSVCVLHSSENIMMTLWHCNNGVAIHRIGGCSLSFTCRGHEITFTVSCNCMLGTRPATQYVYESDGWLARSGRGVW